MPLEASTKRKGVFVIVSVVFSVFLLFLLGCLTIGVVVAVTGNFNNCQGSASFCEQVQERNKLTSYGLMIAATVAAILFFPPIATLLVYFLIELISGRAGEDQPDGNACELRQKEESDDLDGANGHLDDGCIEFENHMAVKFDVKKLRGLNIPAAVVLGFTFGCFISSLIAFLWMIVVAYDNPTSLTTQVSPFIVTELIAGLVCPLLALVGCGLGAIVTTFVIDEEGVDLRMVIHRLLPAVMLRQDKQSVTYWEIIGHYYIKLKEKPWGEKGDLRYAVSRNLSTWLLVCISGFAIILATSSYINGSFVETVTVSTMEFLEESNLCTDYACFGPVTFDHLTANCSELNPEDLANYDVVHCFRFIPFGTGIITNIAISVAFYLATVHSLQIIFFVTFILHASKFIKAWGGFMIFAGVATFFGAIAYIFSPHYINVRLDVIVGGQIILVAVYLGLIGVLLLIGNVHSIKKKKSAAATAEIDAHSNC